MPIASAACWSSATARIAIPWRERVKKNAKATSATATRPSAQSLLAPTCAPSSSTPLEGMNSGNARGVVPQMMRTSAPSTWASPIVTMITEMIGWPTSGRRIRRSTTIPSTIATSTAPSTAKAQCSPASTVSAQTTYAPMRRNCPWAKLITDEDL